MYLCEYQLLIGIVLSSLYCHDRENPVGDSVFLIALFKAAHVQQKALWILLNSSKKINVIILSDDKINGIILEQSQTQESYF